MRIQKKNQIKIRPAKNRPWEGSNAKPDKIEALKDFISIRTWKKPSLVQIFMLSGTIVVLAVFSRLLLTRNAPDSSMGTKRTESPTLSGELTARLERDTNFKRDNFIISVKQDLSPFFHARRTNLSAPEIDRIVNLLRENRFRYLSKNDEVNFYFSRDKDDLYFISIQYEPGKFVIIRRYPYLHLVREDKQIQIVRAYKSAIVRDLSTQTPQPELLYRALEENNIPESVVPFIEKALGWSVDLHHLNVGDRFKLIYEASILDGKILQILSLDAIEFRSEGRELYGFSMPELDSLVYFDEAGKPLKKRFLMSPIKYGRITSGYNPNRIHPILNEVKPHFGTDYGANMGTPILAVGDGKITVADYTKNNGNYVKIRHDDAYETQYLHMGSFATGIAPGRRVRQGEVIGYVGMTGLATGPHVCFRYWKNGQQIDHLKDIAVDNNSSISTANDLSQEELKRFTIRRDSLFHRLQGTAYR